MGGREGQRRKKLPMRAMTMMEKDTDDDEEVYR